MATFQFNIKLDCTFPNLNIAEAFNFQMSGKTKPIGQSKEEVTGSVYNKQTSTIYLYNWVQYETNPCGICGGQSDNGRGFSPNFTCQFRSSNAPYSFFHPSVTLQILTTDSVIK